MSKHYLLEKNGGNLSITFVVVYVDDSDDDGYARVATVSGTTISWGTAVEFSNNNDLIASNSALSTKLAITDSSSISAERSLYWNVGDNGWAGGHCSIGSSEPTTTWYFVDDCRKGYCKR